MVKNYHILLQDYFKRYSLVEANIRSFNHFVEHGLQSIIDEIKEIEPSIIPANIDELKIRFNKITIGRPEIVEADGSVRPLLPREARIRNLTYASRVNLSIATYINGVERESFETQIAQLPIMVKSKLCHLHGLPRDKLIEYGEDPDDPGGYFIINGSEKVVVSIEDLASNNFIVTKESVGPSAYVGKIFSEAGPYKIPHTIEKLKDGIFYISFTQLKRIPVIVLIKALGVVKDEEIMQLINTKFHDDIFINLYEFVDIKDQEEALEYIARALPMPHPKEIRVQRIREILSRFLLPHLGREEKDNYKKAVNLCKYLKKMTDVINGKLNVDDKDHYMNKRIKMSGELLYDLFMTNFRILIADMLYNFHRIVKRGKLPSVRVIIREKLLSSKIKSAMATGSWVGGRKGIAQRMQRLNFLEAISHLQRVVSPLSTTQENFEARELHPTHIGKLCPIETPEGTNIGLRKNLALLATVSEEAREDDIIRVAKSIGLKEKIR